MELLTFRVQNYKCLQDTGTIKLFNDLTVLTGENDAGKSSLMRALELFLSPKNQPSDRHFYKPQTEQDEETLPDDMHMEATFRLSPFEQTIWNNHFGSLVSQPDQVLVSRTYVYGKNGAPSFQIQAELPVDSRFHNIDGLSIAELKELAQAYSIDLAKSKLKADIKVSIETWLKDNAAQLEKNTATVELPKPLSIRLPIIEIFSSESAKDPREAIHSMLKGEFRKFVRSDQLSRNLATVEGEINDHLTNYAKAYVDSIKRYVPSIDQVEIRPQFDFSGGLSDTHLALGRGNRKVMLSESGAGQKRRITLAIYEAKLDMLKREDRENVDEMKEDTRDLILAFDEPDTHLDYNWQRKIFDTVMEFANLAAVQVITCTHSLNFIDRVPIQQIAHFYLDEHRTTQCEVFSFDDLSFDNTLHNLEDEFRLKISEQMGLRNSILLHERCFLVVEGETEMKALPVLFDQLFGMSLQTAGICLLNGQNNSGVIEVVKFLHQHKRSVLFLIDSDSEPSNALYRKLQNIGIPQHNIYTVGKKEFEDAFANSLWVDTLNRIYQQQSGQEWTEADVQECREHHSKAFSKALNDKIYDKVSRHFKKPDAGYHLAKAIRNDQEIPAEVKDCFAAAYHTANPSSEPLGCE